MEFEHNLKICINKPTCVDPGIFVGDVREGGGRGGGLAFISPQLILQMSNGLS